jgi:hypothetical protein
LFPLSYTIAPGALHYRIFAAIDKSKLTKLEEQIAQEGAISLTNQLVKFLVDAITVI